MLCTLIWDTYADGERLEVFAAMRRLLPRQSKDWSQKGVYAFWDPDTRDLLYVGLASNLPQRFAQHNGLVAHPGGGNKSREINQWFSAHDRLGLTLIIQGAAVQILEDVQSMNPMIGAEARGIAQIVEGQLIELHKQATGRFPPWNKISGSKQGAEWAQPSAQSVVRLLSGADDSLFVSRRTLRALILDKRALQMEALMHAARMHALMEIHEMDFELGEGARPDIDKIMRILMLIDGKLIDDLGASDDRIQEWVERFTRPGDMSADRSENQSRMEQLAAETAPGNPDHASARFLAGFLEADADGYNSRVAADILRSNYLSERPLLTGER